MDISIMKLDTLIKFITKEMLVALSELEEIMTALGNMKTKYLIHLDMAVHILISN